MYYIPKRDVREYLGIQIWTMYFDLAKINKWINLKLFWYSNRKLFWFSKPHCVFWTAIRREGEDTAMHSHAKPEGTVLSHISKIIYLCVYCFCSVRYKFNPNINLFWFNLIFSEFTRCWDAQQHLRGLNRSNFCNFWMSKNNIWELLTSTWHVLHLCFGFVLNLTALLSCIHKT